jgi:hypothetical protein
VERRTGVLVEVLLEVLLEQAFLGEARGFPRGARHSYSDSPVTSGSESWFSRGRQLLRHSNTRNRGPPRPSARPPPPALLPSDACSAAL